MSREQWERIVKFRVAQMLLPFSIAKRDFNPLTKEYWDDINRTYAQKRDEIRSWFKTFGVWQDGEGTDINYVLKETFVADGYFYNDEVSVQENDVVFDVGANIGDTALNFARRTKGGRIHAFEPEPSCYAALVENIAGFPDDTAKCIEPHSFGFSASKCELPYLSMQGNIGGSKIVSQERATNYIKVDTIDNFVTENNIGVVNFIKADIEGAELAMLKGAAQTIKKFKPTLAICIYHKPEDIREIPRFIRGLNKNYKFYLKHNLDNNAETVLFAYNADEEQKEPQLPTQIYSLPSFINNLHDVLCELHYGNYLKSVLREINHKIPIKMYRNKINKNWLDYSFNVGHYRLLVNENSFTVELVFHNPDKLSLAYQREAQRICKEFISRNKYFGLDSKFERQANRIIMSKTVAHRDNELNPLVCADIVKDFISGTYGELVATGFIHDNSSEHTTNATESEYEKNLKKAAQENAQLQQRITDLETSTSWKLTAPIRAVVRIFKRKK